ncbi:MAG: RluA family pseudouridine synthase [Oscillospiraceae bacterium]
MDILYQDNSILVCIKPAGVLSTDEPGGVPELVRQALGDPKACVRTVHRLDRVVSGLMVLARTPAAASKLSAQIREHDFGKTYLAVVHGEPDALQGTYRDLLRRDANERKTYVTDKMAKGVQEAVLDYDVLGTRTELSLVRIYLQTGRTHQIRCQFSARGLPHLGRHAAARCPMTGRSHSGRTACTLPIRTPARCSVSSSSRRTAPLEPVCIGPKHPAPRRGAFFAQVRDSFPSKCLAIAGCVRYNMGISPVL